MLWIFCGLKIMGDCSPDSGPTNSSAVGETENKYCSPVNIKQTQHLCLLSDSTDFTRSHLFSPTYRPAHTPTAPIKNGLGVSSNCKSKWSRGKWNIDFLILHACFGFVIQNLFQAADLLFLLLTFLSSSFSLFLFFIFFYQFACKWHSLWTTG